LQRGRHERNISSEEVIRSSTRGGVDPSTLERARLGEEEALTTLFRTYAPRVLAFAIVKTGQRALAEEVLQESFIRMWTGIASLRHLERFEQWFWKIAVNCARDAIRNELRARPELDEEPQVDALSSVEDRVVLLRALATLPDDLRSAVTLYYLMGQSERETATSLGWRTGTLKSRLHRARSRLERILAGEVEGDTDVAIRQSSS
jgi:RNA polymerase sigma-70 factor (ECF subfamily)